MRYYLVALLDKESNLLVEAMQRNLCRKYRFHKNVASLYIPVEAVGDPDMEKLIKVIVDMMKPYKKFKVELGEFVDVDINSRTVNINIINKGYICRIVRNINEMLRLHGFDVKERSEKTDLCITIAGASYSHKELSEKQIALNWEAESSEDVHKMVKVDRIELWKSLNNKKDMLIRSFQLREY